MLTGRLEWKVVQAPFVSTAVTFPEPATGKVTSTVFFVGSDVINAPGGRLQEYVDPAVKGTLYVIPDEPTQTSGGPAGIVPRAADVTVTEYGAEVAEHPVAIIVSVTCTFPVPVVPVAFVRMK